MHAISRSILTEKTEYQEVGIIESPVYGKILLLDGDMQSAQMDEFVYHEALVHPAMTLHPDPVDVLIIGGGEGATLREVARHTCVKAIHMLDIDGRLVEICKEHMPEWSRGSFSDPRLTLTIGDANIWIRETSLKFDVIISDLTEPLSTTPSAGIFSLEFFGILRKLLKPSGILAMQASRGDITDMQVHSALYKTLSQVFPVVRSYQTRIPSYDLIWSFLFASEELDPVKMDIDAIDRTIMARVGSVLEFYDGETHRNIFSLPKHFRRKREEIGRKLKIGEIPRQKEPAFIL